MTDFQHKAELILQQAYPGPADWRQDVYLVLHFVDCVDEMVTWYFYAPEIDDHKRLARVLKDLGATKTVDTLQRVIGLSRRPDQVLERFDLIGDTSELVDDAWEEVSYELSRSMDANIRQLVYEKFMRDRDLDEFVST